MGPIIAVYLCYSCHSNCRIKVRGAQGKIIGVEDYSTSDGEAEVSICRATEALPGGAGPSPVSLKPSFCPHNRFPHNGRNLWDCHLSASKHPDGEPTLTRRTAETAYLGVLSFVKRPQMQGRRSQWHAHPLFFSKYHTIQVPPILLVIDLERSSLRSPH